MSGLAWQVGPHAHDPCIMGLDLSWVYPKYICQHLPLTQVGPIELSYHKPIIGATLLINICHPPNWRKKASWMQTPEYKLCLDSGMTKLSHTCDNQFCNTTHEIIYDFRHKLC